MQEQRWCDCYLVTKLSASRSSTVCLSMLGGTKSRPFLAQRVARLGERIWHTQRFGQICARTAMATASITHSNSLSMVTTQPGQNTCNIRQRKTQDTRDFDVGNTKKKKITSLQPKPDLQTERQWAESPTLEPENYSRVTELCNCTGTHTHKHISSHH